MKTNWNFRAKALLATVALMTLVIVVYQKSYHFAEIYQHKDSLKTEGPGAWNNTIVIACHGFMTCAVMVFSNGRDYVHEPVWYPAIVSAYREIDSHNDMVRYNSMERCVFAGRFGVQAVVDPSDCRGHRRMHQSLISGPFWEEADGSRADVNQVEGPIQYRYDI